MTLDEDLRALFTAHRRTFLLRAAQRAGLPEALGDDTRTVAELAVRAGCHPPTLRRALRALAALDLVAESPADAFHLTERGRLLRPDVAGSVRGPAAFELDEWMLLEQMLPEGVDGSLPAEVYLDDVDSVVTLGGRWRTEPEYRSLLDAAGFTMSVHPRPSAPAGYRLLEAAPR